MGEHPDTLYDIQSLFTQNIPWLPIQNIKILSSGYAIQYKVLSFRLLVKRKKADSTPFDLLPSVGYQ
jgi:hypothetical protein